MSSVPPKPVVQGRAVPSTATGTLSKSVFALAIEPLTMSLTVTGRKAYDVMLWIAQRGTPAADGGYSSPVSSILRGYGSTTKASERVQRYIEQMVQTTVLWRPLAASEQATPMFEGFEGTAPDVISDEARTFPLLAEARLYVRGGEAWVTWYYPPSIKEQLISPERWAQIELNSIARLSTYTAVALYEICARYKDVPGGLTSRHEPNFWTSVLREGGGIKPREFRKFKNELLIPAIHDINARTEINVELVEHREHGSLVSVQFRVAKATQRQPQVPQPADVTLVMHAARLGISEAELDGLLQKFDETRIEQAMAAMESYINDPTAKPVINRPAYLKTILANSQPEKAAAIKPRPAPVVVPKSALDPAHDEGTDQTKLIAAWKADRLRRIRSEFASLSDEEKSKWVETTQQSTPATLLSPAIRKRFKEQSWESPLITQLVLDTYAGAIYGKNWAQPSEIDLAMFAAHREPREGN